MPVEYPIPLGFGSSSGGAIGELNFLGTWDAGTNTPSLSDGGTGTAGDFYKVSVAGSTSLDGITDWNIGDWVITTTDGAGSRWEKIDQTEVVASVFGRTGTVSATASDYDASQVDNDSGVAGAFVSDALDTNASAASDAQSDIDGHVDGGANKHDASEVDVEGALAHFPAGDLQTSLGTANTDISSNASAAAGAQSDIDDHVDGGANKHDASEVDVEGALAHFPAGDLQTSLGTANTDISSNASAAAGAQSDIDGHVDGGANKHDASEVDVEGSLTNFPAGDLQTSLGTADTAISSNTSHASGDGSDHADVAANTAARHSEKTGEPSGGFVSTSAGAGDSGKGVLLDGSGLLSTTFLPSGASGRQTQKVSGGTTLDGTGSFVDVTNGTTTCEVTLTGLADGNIVLVHFSAAITIRGAGKPGALTISATNMNESGDINTPYGLVRHGLTDFVGVVTEVLSGTYTFTKSGAGTSVITLRFNGVDGDVEIDFAGDANVYAEITAMKL